MVRREPTWNIFPLWRQFKWGHSARISGTCVKIVQLFKAVVELQQWLVLSQKMVRRFVTYKSDVVLWTIGNNFLRVNILLKGGENHNLSSWFYCVECFGKLELSCKIPWQI